MIVATEQTYLFAEFEVDAKKRLLLKNTQIIALNSKAFDLLIVLIENRGQILNKEKLLEIVWANQFVEENNLTVHISALRKIFGEKKGEHQFIATIPGKGYKFVADVRLASEELQLINSNISALTQKTLPSFEASQTLIGRDREISEIKHLLLEENVNLLTLTGTGGSGKTSLVQVVANELRNDFADGVFFVELASATETSFVVSAIAQTLEISEANDKSVLEKITEFLQTRQILLILDNFEQVLSAAPILKEFLANAASLKIIVTSRTLLRIVGEREFAVSPLNLPPPNSAFLIESIDKYPAIALFRQRAQSVKTSFALTSANIESVAEICRRLDGLPLAIELAAARIKLLTPKAILQRLENSLKLLTGGSNDLPERQRTMRSTIRWSYDLLTPNEQILFRRLAIFVGGFSIEAAESVGSWHLAKNSKEQCFSSEGQPSAEILDLINALIDNNLLVSKWQTDGNMRLRMLEVVREFAFEVLLEMDEFEDLQQIHAHYFLSLAEEAELFLQGEKSIEWLGILEIEHDNLRAALSWSLKKDGQIAARIAAALRFFWLNHCHLSEGLSWSKAALETTENTVSKARSSLLLSNGVFLRTQGDFGAARNVYEKTLAESRQINDFLQIIKANHGLAAIAVLEKDFDSAQLFIEESLALSRELGDEMQTAYSLGSLGDLELSRKNLSAARPLLEECLMLAKKLCNNKLLSVIYYNLGTIDYYEQLPQLAASNFAESLRIAKDLGNLTMISCSIEGFAALASICNKIELSAELAGFAQGLNESTGCLIEPAEEIFREEYLTRVKAVLDEKTFASLYENGKKMNLDEAIELALPPQTNKIWAETDVQTTEIIIENRSFSRILVEEVDDSFQNHPVIEAKNKVSNFTKELLIAPSNLDENNSRSHKIWLGFGILAILGAVLLGGGSFWWQSAQSNSGVINSFGKVNVKQLTTNGKVVRAALAPSGKAFAYVVSDSGQRSLWLGYVDGGNHLLLRPAVLDAQYSQLAFAPDSNRLYFSYRDDRNSRFAIYQIPVGGGVQEKVAEGIDNFSLSPDGGKIAYGRPDGENDLLIISNIDGSEPIEIATFPKAASIAFNSISWSPDGKRLAFGRVKEVENSLHDLAIIEIINRKIEIVKSDSRHKISNTSWMKDSSGLVVSALKDSSQASFPQYRLIHFDLASGKTDEITNDLSSYDLALDLSADSNSILTIEQRQMNNIWIAPADNLSAAKQITFGSFGKYDGLWGLDFTPDGKIIYTNSDTQSQFISEMNADGSNPKPLTAPGMIDSVLNISNDGRYIVFHSNRNNGGFDIWRTDINGNNPKQLTFGKTNYQPFVSADNSWVYYRSLEKSVGELRRVSIDGGEPEILNDKETSWLSFSPNGKYFAASYKTDKTRLAIFDATTNEVFKQFDFPKNGTMSLGSRWSPDSSSVAFRDWNDGYWLQSIEGGEPKKMQGLPKEKLYNFAWSKDGKQFAFVRGQEIRDVVLITGVK